MRFFDRSWKSSLLIWMIQDDPWRGSSRIIQGASIDKTPRLQQKFKKIVLNYTFLGSLSVCCFSWRKDSQLPLSVMFTEMSSANCPPDNSWILSPSFSWLIGGHPGRTRIHTQSEWEMFPFHLIMSYSLYLPANRYLTNDFLKGIKLEL